MIKAIAFGLMMCIGFLLQWTWQRVGHFWAVALVLATVIGFFLPDKNSWLLAGFFLAGAALHVLHGMWKRRSTGLTRVRRSGTLA